MTVLAAGDPTARPAGQNSGCQKTAELVGLQVRGTNPVPFFAVSGLRPRQRKPG
jgi:hypothetical protein